MSCDLVKKKAVIIRYPKDITSFKFWDGWLEDWKIRHGIREHKRHGQSGEVGLRVVSSNLPMLRNILGIYLLGNIYNMDETAFFYQLLPDRSLATQLWECGSKAGAGL